MVRYLAMVACEMKALRLVIAMLCTTGVLALSRAEAGAPGFDFGLREPVTIVKATQWMDGGSIAVTLRDARGVEADLAYADERVFSVEERGGQFGYRRGGEEEGAQRVYLPRLGAAEQELLALLRRACEATFGTAEVEKMRAGPDWNRKSMGALFRQVALRKGGK